MKSWKSALVLPSATIGQVIARIDESTLQIALVVDENNHLLGTVTDGDIRRGILRGLSVLDPVTKVMNPHPQTAAPADDRSALLAIMQQLNIRQLPIIDDGVVVGLEMLDTLLSPQPRENYAVLMAGGLGERLWPLTKECPKPMLSVGGRPILETLLLTCIEYGVRRFYFSLNYRADQIREYFGDGSRWGVQIQFIQETQRLGTAGSLSLLPEVPSQPFLVINADLLTKVNFGSLLEYHVNHCATATMTVREYDLQVPYGVLKLDGHRILKIIEKPVHRFFVNAGIYVLDPDALKFIPKEQYFDMPSLFDNLIEGGRSTAAFPIREYWLDVGQMTDYERANGDYIEEFLR